MAMRGSEANQQSELFGSTTNTAFSNPDLVDPLPLLFSDLLTRPTYRGAMASFALSCHRRRRVPVIFLFRHHGPETSRHFVRQGDSGNHAWLAPPQANKPSML